MIIITSAKKAMFSVLPLFFCVFVCLYLKSTSIARIWVKFFQQMTIFLEIQNTIWSLYCLILLLWRSALSSVFLVIIFTGIIC